MYACCTRAEQRDLLAAKLLEAAYEGLGCASTSRDLGPALPRLTALVQLIATHGANLQRQSSVQQPVEHTVDGYGTGPNRGSCSMQMTDNWDRDRSNNLPEGTSLWQNSPMGATEATNSSRKRQAEEYPGDLMGSQPKRQQTEHGPVSAEVAVSSTAPTSNVASLMTSLEQEVALSSQSTTALNVPALVSVCSISPADAGTSLTSVHQFADAHPANCTYGQPTSRGTAHFRCA